MLAYIPDEQGDERAAASPQYVAFTYYTLLMLRSSKDSHGSTENGEWKVKINSLQVRALVIMACRTNEAINALIVNK